jgi:hypothetical protein
MDLIPRQDTKEREDEPNAKIGTLQQLLKQLARTARRGLPPQIVVAYLDDVYILEPRGDYRDIRTDIRIDNPKGTLYLDVSVISITKEKARKDPYDTLAAIEQTKKNKYRVLGQAFKPFILS